MYSGWNLISTPYLGCVPEQLFTANHISGDLYRYRNDDYETVTPDTEMVPGVGYWIYLRDIAPAGMLVPLQGDDPPAEQKLVPLRVGWNLFGAYDVPEADRHVPDLPFAEPPMAWDAQRLMYAYERDLLALGVGYWARVVDPAQFATVSLPATGDIVVDYRAGTLLLRLGGRFDSLRLSLRERGGDIILAPTIVQPARDGDTWTATIAAPGIVAGREYLLELLPATRGLAGDIRLVAFRATEPKDGQAEAIVLLDDLLATARHTWDAGTFTAIVPDAAGSRVEFQADLLRDGAFTPVRHAIGTLDANDSATLDLTDQHAGARLCVSIRLLDANGTPASSWRTFTATREQD